MLGLGPLVSSASPGSSASLDTAGCGSCVQPLAVFFSRYFHGERGYIPDADARLATSTDPRRPWFVALCCCIWGGETATRVREEGTREMGMGAPLLLIVVIKQDYGCEGNTFT